MTPADFVKTYYPEAYKCYQQTGLHPLAILAQCALETGWGKYCPGNMMFGIKDTDGVNGNEQLLETFEFSKRQNETWGGRRIKSVTPTPINGVMFYKYVIMDYFRKYDTAAESFADHVKFFEQNGYYAQALKLKGDCNAFIDAMAVHYSTSPGYAATLKEIARSIQKIAVSLGITPLVPYT
ncbi:MAG: hypothetical protein JWO03_2241 [Bacteroidetes bacterium]|nr:hypothetical protein [Bacteroidota bacterium]